MNFILPNYKILTEIDGDKILKNLERAIRVAHKSEDLIKEKSAEAIVRRIVHDLKHESTIEHENISARIICDRGVSHEIVRHRLASYTQESTRYCNYAKDKFNAQLTYIIPSWLDENLKKYLLAGNARDSLDTFDQDGVVGIKDEGRAAFVVWWAGMHQAEINYFNLIEHGWTPEKARSVLPNSLKTEIIMTANLREWRHFFTMRTDRAAHPQMREIAVPMLAEFKEKIPIIFEDI